MSQSPESADEAGDAKDAYARGWAAINKLMRRGHSWSGHERNNAFLNLGGRTFVDASHALGFAQADDGRALVPVDWDHDGDLDLFVTNRNDPRVRFLENRSGGESVSLLLRGTTSNAHAVGARVELDFEPGAGTPQRLVRAVRAGEGYLAQDGAWLTFGTRGRAVERVVVHWPGGAAEAFEGVGAGRWVLRQGEGRATAWSDATADAGLDPELASTWPAEESTSDESGRSRVVLAAPVPLPTLALERPGDGEAVALFGIEPGGATRGTGRAVLLSLWASWCAPCTEELIEYAGRTDELDAAGLAFLAVSVDQGDEDRDAARARMEAVGWPLGWVFATPGAIDVLDVLHGMLLDSDVRLPLPASFLVDGSGNLRAMYLGRVDPQQLLADVALTRLPAEEMRDAATPFRGTWHRPSPEVDFAFLERRFAARGLADVAREYGRGRLEVVQTSRGQMLFEFGRRAAIEGRLEEAAGYLRRAVDEDPRLVAAHMDLGVVLHRLGRPAEAISAYAAAVRLEPENDDARFNMALAYLAAGDARAARKQVDALRERASPLADELERQIELRE